MLGKVFDHPINKQTLIITSIIGNIAICKYIDNGKITALSLELIKDI
jgi:hypothetical protein